MIKEIFSVFTEILLSELKPALGCTEPIAIAFATAKLREVLNGVPDRIDMACSGNIIKNVKAVTIPNSGGKKGIAYAVALGAIGGNARKELRALEDISDQDREKACKYVEEKRVNISLVEKEENLYLLATGYLNNDVAEVEIKYDHTRLNKVVKNNLVLHDAGIDSTLHHDKDLSLLSMKNIIDFANNVDIMSNNYLKLKEALQQQVKFNLDIGREGLINSYGAEIGKTFLNFPAMDKNLVEAIATAAAGSDARMSGCSLPVVINSGSGNQGMTIAIPIAIYARNKEVNNEKLYRALLLANLVAIHEKRFIGKLSAFCGVVSAAAAAGAGLAYIMDMNEEQIGMVITNILATSGGMVCDGAKPSCASKIAISLCNAMIAINMAALNKTFHYGDGLVGNDIDETISNFGRMARVGMKYTDVEILKIMIEENKGRCKEYEN